MNMNNLFKVCIGITVIASAAIFIFKVPVNNVLIYGAILLCPLMHMLMLNHRAHSNTKNNKAPQDHTSH